MTVQLEYFYSVITSGCVLWSRKRTDGIQETLRAVNKKLQADVATLKFENAFDKAKLDYYYGIRGDLSLWIQSFLSNHVQKAAVDGKGSSRCSVTTGVPQGSVQFYFWSV